ncbi:hypothetical protein Q9L58_006845 [Maublancomyces gigas]|uniref:RING-type domain-containing protein n=1 Tax=Discina gigas TaxID=1032678 RepID=A0ABR3GES3_9PEZI
MPPYSDEPGPEPEIIIISDDDLDNSQLFPARAVKRRRRHQPYERRRPQRELTTSKLEPKLKPEPNSGTSSWRTPRARKSAQSASSTLRGDNYSAINGAVLAAIEQVWELEKTADTGVDCPPFSAPPDPSNPDQAASQVTSLLGILYSIKPVDGCQLTVWQKRFITTVFTSFFTIIQQIRILEVCANEPLNPLPDAQDDTLKVDSGCVVCYERVADMLMIPCRHLTLCEVCCHEIQKRVQGELVRCPICREDVVYMDKIYRS